MIVIAMTALPLFVRNRIGHHLAARRTCSPASERGGKLPRRAPGHKNMYLLGRAEFLVALFAANRDLFIVCCKLSTLGALRNIVIAHRNTGSLEQILPCLLFAEAVTGNCLHMLRAEHHDGLRHQAQAVTPYRSQRE